MSYGYGGVQGVQSAMGSLGAALKGDTANNTMPALVQPFAPMADGPGLSARVVQLESVIAQQAQAIAELADAIRQLRGIIGV